MTTPNSTSARQLWFSQPQRVEVREILLPSPGTGELLVQTLCSAVSAGTEMLIYRGQVPNGMELDSGIAGMQQALAYPLQYGYACVGQVLQTGAGVDASLVGRNVFSFQPHASHFITRADNALPLPAGIEADAAVFLANMETAVNLVQDGSPQIGENVVVLGQGVVGLLLGQLLSEFPLESLYAVDGIPARRELGVKCGMQQAFDPHGDIDELKARLASCQGADLIYEVSGNPEALNLAVDLGGFASRIVIGSWYGNKTSNLALGGAAHRNRLQIITSQVSSIAPGLTGRWNKQRRFELAWKMLRKLVPQQMISHRLPLTEADRLYKMLDQNPAEVLQAVFDYRQQ